MKKILLIMMAVTLSLGVMAGCSSETPAAEEGAGAEVKETVLKIAFNQSENHPQYKALATFGEKLKEQTAGAYSLEIAPNALLGDQRATAELVQSGTIAMAVVGNPIVENFNKEFAVIGLPYIYDSLDHQKEVFTSGILDELFASTEANGFIVAGSFTAGSRNVYTDKPIETPEDLAGYKIRVMESDTMVKMLGFMGGVGTPMGQGEVYTAVQQGVLEGGENNEVTYADLKHYEIAPYFSYTQHLMVPDLIIINDDIFNAMTAENKEIFENLMKETIVNEFEVWNESVEAAKATAIENGATFVDVDIKPFQDNVTPLHDEVTGASDGAKAIYEAIRGLVK